ncbi:MAG: hypothetical protein QG560_126 [Campylobacterota bacterium]|nr:hypothetical protein [Campylobacterota bacterium]
MLPEELEKKFVEEYSFNQNKYSVIENKLGINRHQVRELYEKCKPEIESIQKIRNKFTGQRRTDFNNDFKKFYTWYQKQVQEVAKCYYCDITQDELNILFREEEILPLNDAIKRSSGSLEIERKDSTSNSYGSENIVLACPLCNNAKSNLIDEDSWKALFTPPMKEYYKKLLDKAKSK